MKARWLPPPGPPLILEGLRPSNTLRRFPDQLTDRPAEGYPLVGGAKEGGQSQKKEGGKASGWGQKSGQNIGNPYQMEDNKNPKGAARSAAPLGRRRS